MNINELEKSWYELVELNKEIYIFGTGKVGLKLFDLLKTTHGLDKFCGFVVSDESKNPNGVFGYDVINSNSIINKNALILISVSDKYHKDVYMYLKDKGFSNIVNAIIFYMLEGRANSKRIIKTSNKEDFMELGVRLTEEELLARDKILDFFKQIEMPFDGNKPYQSYPRLGIKGVRDTKNRLDKYDIFRFVNSKTDILDIGCNYGFLDMTLAKSVKSITALEYSNDMVVLARDIQKILAIKNIDFISGDYNDFQENVSNESFDVILSFAVHIWLNIEPIEYAKQLFRMLRKDGKVFFESQTYDSDTKFKLFCDSFSEVGMREIYSCMLKDDGCTPRKMVVFSK